MMRKTFPPPAAQADWALFLDIDGTLLDLAPTPDAVVMPQNLPSVLKSLARALGGALALVSGRSLDSIDTLFPGQWDAVGCHGAEWRRGGRAVIPKAPWSEEFVAGIEAAASLLPGVVLERKRLSLALHFRAAPEQEAAVRDLAEAVVGKAYPRLGLLEGKSVIEVIPAGISKGAAIERFMAVPPYAGKRPVFAGDDVTDESGFAAVNRMGGISIHVGNSALTTARFRFPDCEAMRHWLGGLNTALGGDQDNEHP